MTHRWLAVGAAASATALILIWWIDQSSSQTRNPSGGSTSGALPTFSVQAPTESEPVATHDSLATPSSAVVALSKELKDVESSIEISEAEFEQRQAKSAELLRRRGYVDWPSTHPAYLAYDDETLTVLAQGGDPLAQTWLAAKKTYTDPHAAIDLYRAAALRGSTFSVLQIAQIQRKFAEGRLTDSGYYKSADTPQKVPSEHLPEAVAWGMVALARGDEVAIPFLDDLRRESPLTAQELAVACRKFNDYYNDLATDRMHLGLGEFVNTPSPLVAVGYAAASACDEWPAPKPICRAYTRNGQRLGYQCDSLR